MNIYFIILIIMHILNIGIALGKYGEDKLNRYSFLTTLLGRGIGIALLVLAVKTGF